MNMKIKGMTGREGPGILNPNKLGSIVMLCWMEKVRSCAKHVFMKTVLSIIGSMRIRIFVSSTCVTVHSLQGPGVIDGDAPEKLLVLRIAAWSKNLRNLMDEMLFNY